MAKKAKINPAESIRKMLEAAEIVIGEDRTMKFLKQGRLSKVMVTSNCKEDVKSSLEKYAALSKTEYVQLEIANDELGVACKKPFSISVVGVVKSK